MPNFVAPQMPFPALDRRKVLSSAASSALILALGLPTFASAEKGETPAAGDIDPLALLDESLAQALIGSLFNIQSETAFATLRLNNVDLNITPFNKGRAITTRSFALEFEVLSNTGLLQQDTYRVSHMHLGHFDLLLVPHTNSKGSKILSATFSRLK